MEVGQGTKPWTPNLTLEKIAMKKTLIALAVLATSGAAMAQSTVTLYGRVDASVGTTKNTVTGVSTTSVFNGGAGGLTGSRWGLQGSEDLGGGLKAIFKLENRFNVDTGSDTDGFTGDAYVGVSGGFGTVYLGRTYTAYDSVHALSLGSNVFDSAFTPVGDVYGSGGGYTNRGANQIKYASPNFGGVSVSVSHALDEDATVSTDVTSLAVMYGAGPLKVGGAYQADTTADFTTITGAYDFGVVSLSGGWSDRDGATSDDTEFSMGVNVPLNAVNLSAGFAVGKTKDATGTTAKASGFGFGATYTLSKRTKLYAGFKDTKIKNAAGVKTTGTRLLAAGIRHDF
jgi:predicted porin